MHMLLSAAWQIEFLQPNIFIGKVGMEFDSSEMGNSRCIHTNQTLLSPARRALSFLPPFPLPLPLPILSPSFLLSLP
jgi:hypothetical protein